MLLLVDLPAVRVLLFVDLAFLLLVECATIVDAFVVNLLRDARLIGVGASGFTRGLLAGAQTLRYPLLLVRFTIVDLVWRNRVAVVFFVVDLPARGVLDVYKRQH